MDKKQLEKDFAEFTKDQDVKDWVQFLDNTGYRYSPYNTMLILMQNRGRSDKERAKFKCVCHSYGAWKKQGNQVMSKADMERIYGYSCNGYAIYVPISCKKEVEKTDGETETRYFTRFKIGYTFDVSQTLGYADYLDKEKEINEAVYERAMPFEAGKEILDKVEGIKVEYGDDEKAYYDRSKDLIHIGSGQKRNGGTVLHEIGHYLTKEIGKEENYAVNEILAELCNVHLHRVFGYKFNYNYSKIWASRTDLKMDFDKFAKLYRATEKTVDEFVESQKLKQAA